MSKSLQLKFYDKDVKMILAIRRDLKMRRGKECSMAGHASSMWLAETLTDLMAASKSTILPGTVQFDHDHKISSFSLAELYWLTTNFKKVTVQVESEEELLKIEADAKRAGLRTNLVVDSGLTEFKGVPTRTCLAIGPDESEKIDLVTGHLKLY